MAKGKTRTPLEQRPLPWLRKTKWDLFSKWLRLCYADRKGFCTCCTCGHKLQWNRGIHAGHCTHNPPQLKYHFWNVAPQCEICNCFKDGARAQYKEYVIRRYGRAALNKLDAAGWEPLHEDRCTLARDIRELRVNLKAIQEYRRAKSCR